MAISMIDSHLWSFLKIENEMWLEIIDECRESFTPEHQEKTRQFIRKIIICSATGMIKGGV